MKEFYFDSDEIHDIDYIVIDISDEELAMLSDKTDKQLDSVPKFDDADIMIYPNPNQGKFKIELNIETTEPLQITIYDTMGREVF